MLYTCSLYDIINQCYSSERKRILKREVGVKEGKCQEGQVSSHKRVIQEDVTYSTGGQSQSILYYIVQGCPVYTPIKKIINRKQLPRESISNVLITRKKKFFCNYVWVTDVNQIDGDDHFTIYTSIELLCCTLKLIQWYGSILPRF